MEIKIGVTGWGDHDSLYPDRIHSSKKLRQYCMHFPIVEIDSSYYSIMPQSNYQKWVNQTTTDFSFIVKAYGGITGHSRQNYSKEEQILQLTPFLESIQPLIEANKLKGILFQFPPWFNCKKENVEILRTLKSKLKGLPAILEFRNQTWFYPRFYEQTLKFMEDEGWIHSICDEPQAGNGSIPIVLHPTDPNITLIRFHGRNIYGWNHNGQDNWREVRYLYRYNEEELYEWVERIEQLSKNTKEICILFNNNSGGDAADNAKQLMKLLGIEFGPSSTEQLELF
ncbi:DUF72 domain-containing protein [Gottfriedia acidiceleris]|uniref:DUF72 domain-containing protein n=1 Tax=Gottfriedia acidiceleris TaxID=371036 RepID=UPI002FFEB3FB